VKLLDQSNMASGKRKAVGGDSAGTVSIPAKIIYLCWSSVWIMYSIFIMFGCRYYNL